MFCAVEDDSGDENTKVKNSNNDAEEDNCGVGVRTGKRLRQRSRGCEEGRQQQS